MGQINKRTDLAEIDRRRLLRLEAQAKSRATEADVEAHRAELLTQGEARGSEYLTPPAKRGERRKPIRRLTGLDMLRRRKRADGKPYLSDDQYAAGLRYGTAYRRYMLEPPLRSILNRDIAGNDSLTLAKLQEHALGTERARQRLAMYRGQLMGQADLINACDAVCGLERTPRESAVNGRTAERIEALLMVGLDLLALHLAPTRPIAAPLPQDAERAA